MEDIKIEKYSPEHYSEVVRIFKEGHKGRVKNGIQFGLTSPKVQFLFFLALCLGFYSSLDRALLFLVITILLHIISVFDCFYTYVEYHLGTDMKDRELRFWTTKPNIFLVAKASGKVVGIVSYQIINPDTAEMNRLGVDNTFRGLKIGQKLVEECMKLARKDGYKVMYLETTSANISAIKLYKKLGYEFLRAKGFGPRSFGCSFFVNTFSGLHVSAFIKKL